MRHSLVDRTRGHGIYSLGSTATLEGVIVRTSLLSTNGYGRGMSFEYERS